MMTNAPLHPAKRGFEGFKKAALPIKVLFAAFVAVFFLFPFFSKSISAQQLYCPASNCDPGYTTGTCNTGAVLKCCDPLVENCTPTVNKECAVEFGQARWVKTDKGINPDCDGIIYLPIVKPSIPISYIKFIKSICQKSAGMDAAHLIMGGICADDSSSDPSSSSGTAGVSGLFNITVMGAYTALAGVPKSIVEVGSNPSEYPIAMNRGLIGSVSSMIGSFYSKPPASSGEYFAYVAKNLGIVKPAYAQGVGYTGLTPLIPVWTLFRNTAYIFYIIIFIAVGFAIMFKAKLNSQTVISIENALPKIIVSLILITFSYAIAGFLIDLIYVVISLLFAVLGLSSSTLDYNQNIFSFVSFFKSSLIGNSYEASDNIINMVSSSIFGADKASILGIAKPIGALIIAIAILYSMFKLFFSLVISYISIVVGVVAAPFMIMMDAIPGQKGFSGWLKLMISNLIPFPLVVGLFALMYTLSTYATAGEIWAPPGLGRLGASSGYIPFIIGLGGILAAPTLVDTVKKSFGGGGIGGLAGAVTAPLQYGAKYGPGTAIAGISAGVKAIREPGRKQKEVEDKLAIESKWRRKEEARGGS